MCIHFELINKASFSFYQRKLLCLHTTRIDSHCERVFTLIFIVLLMTITHCNKTDSLLYCGSMGPYQCNELQGNSLFDKLWKKVNRNQVGKLLN